jgi:gluconokinase
MCTAYVEAMSAVVVGIDVGTTATKVVAANRQARVLHQVERDYPLRSDEPGEAVQDAIVVRDAAVAALAECARLTIHSGHQIEALSFSAAMHTLVGLDAAGTPITPVFNWADTRAERVAARLRAGPAAAELHQATGTPVHTQSVMVKLAWLTESHGDLAHNVTTWCSLKDFVLTAFVDQLVTDHSMASASGLLDMATLDWSEAAIAVAGIRSQQLPTLVSLTKVLPLAPPLARAVGLPAGLPVVIGGGDGPLANLGVGAVRPGVAALSLGTSGAVRVARDRPGVDERCRTFCYALAEGLWVIGAAVSNGAVVAQWASDSFGVDVHTLLDEAAEVPAGARGLLALPYLFGERAPWWEPDLTGALIGLRRFHGRAEITRALVEGVAQQLALGLDAIRDSGVDVDVVRATGGGFRNGLWSEAIAAALGLELQLAEGSGGSALGAVLLGWRALGEFESLAAAAETVAPTRTVQPSAEASRLMAQRRPAIEQLHQALRTLRMDQ